MAQNRSLVYRRGQANPKRASRSARPSSTAASHEENANNMLEDPLMSQAIDFHNKNGLFSEQALQEALSTQVLVLTGLIAKFADSVLQEDIAHMTAQLVRLGREIVGGRSPPIR